MPKSPRKVIKKPTPISLGEYFSSNFPSARKKNFTEQEKNILRPIAEVLCLLDGNAFFGISVDEWGEDVWYESYLPEAYVIYKANGGDKGWASELSWIKEANHENESVKDAYQEWQLIKMLARKKQ
jgi:alpha-L-arabinofuranosidase